MKRLLLLLLLCVLPLELAADERYNGYCRILETGYPADSATVSVYDGGTTDLATIYSDDAETPKGNPITAGSDGFFFFYAESAEYDINCADGGITAAYTWGNEMLTDVDSLPLRWEDLRVPATSMALGTTNDPDLTAIVDTVRAYLFDPDADQELFFAAQLPHAYSEGTDIVAHVHWSPVDTDTGNVIWGLEYTWANIDAAFAATTSTTTTDAGSGTADDHLYVEFTDLTGTGKTISSMLVCRIYRDADNGSDTYTGDAALLEVDFHYQIDATGSTTETSK